MSSQAGTSIINIDRFCFHPLAKRGLLWSDQGTLLVADLHLGKEATFCRGGIAVPRGATAGTLQMITEMLVESSASTLVILGDLFHARSSLAADIRQSFDEFLKRHRDVHVVLVKGNHDKSTGSLPTHWPMQIVDAPWSVDGVSLAHYPSPPSVGTQLCIAGHLHPAIRLRGAGERKLPCFYFDADMRCITLPAAGEFTGTAMIRPKTNDRVWGISEDEVVELDPRLLAK